MFALAIITLGSPVIVAENILMRKIVNRKQRESRKEHTRQSQALKTAYNKAHRREALLRTEQFRLEKKLRMNAREKRRVKKIRKKRTQHLKSLLDRGLINDEQYAEGMELIKKGEK